MNPIVRWANYLTCLILLAACDPGDGIILRNHSDTPVAVYWGAPHPGSGADARLGPGARERSGRINPRPGSSPLRVQAFAPDGEPIFCREYPPTGDSRAEFEVDIVQGQIECEFGEPVFLHNLGEVPVEVYWRQPLPPYGPDAKIEPGQSRRTLWDTRYASTRGATVMAMAPNGGLHFCRTYTGLDRLDRQWNIEIIPGELTCQDNDLFYLHNASDITITAHEGDWVLKHSYPIHLEPGGRSIGRRYGSAGHLPLRIRGFDSSGALVFCHIYQAEDKIEGQWQVEIVMGRIACG
jgi:hypothetical protein